MIMQKSLTIDSNTSKSRHLRRNLTRSETQSSLQQTLIKRQPYQIFTDKPNFPLENRKNIFEREQLQVVEINKSEAKLKKTFVEIKGQREMLEEKNKDFLDFNHFKMQKEDQFTNGSGGPHHHSVNLNTIKNRQLLKQIPVSMPRKFQKILVKDIKQYDQQFRKYAQQEEDLKYKFVKTYIQKAIQKSLLKKIGAQQLGNLKSQFESKESHIHHSEEQDNKNQNLQTKRVEATHRGSDSKRSFSPRKISSEMNENIAERLPNRRLFAKNSKTQSLGFLKTMNHFTNTKQSIGKNHNDQTLRLTHQPSVDSIGQPKLFLSKDQIEEQVRSRNNYDGTMMNLQRSRINNNFSQARSRRTKSIFGNSIYHTSIIADQGIDVIKEHLKRVTRKTKFNQRNTLTRQSTRLQFQSIVHSAESLTQTNRNRIGTSTFNSPKNAINPNLNTVGFPQMKKVFSISILESTSKPNKIEKLEEEEDSDILSVQIEDSKQNNTVINKLPSNFKHFLVNTVKLSDILSKCKGLTTADKSKFNNTSEFSIF